MATTLTKLRITIGEAAEQLSVHPRVVGRYIRDGKLRGIYPDGKGPGKRVYLDPAEVAAFATGGAEASAAHREQKDGAGFKKIRGRGRSLPGSKA